MRRVALSAVVLFFLTWSGFGCHGADDTQGPPEIRYGYDLCTYCSMTIDTADHAAVARSGSGEEARFDDLSGLRSFLRTSEGLWKAWVHTKEGWIPAEEAWYLRDPEEVTPMGSGLIAFADRGAALEVTSDSDADAPQSWSQFLDAATTNSSSMTRRPDKEGTS